MTIVPLTVVVSFASHHSPVETHRHTFAFSLKLLPEIPDDLRGFHYSIPSSETYLNVPFRIFLGPVLRECLHTHITLSWFFS